MKHLIFSCILLKDDIHEYGICLAWLDASRRFNTQEVGTILWSLAGSPKAGRNKIVCTCVEYLLIYPHILSLDIRYVPLSLCAEVARVLLLGRTSCWPGADLAAPPPPPPLAPPRPPPSRWDWLRVREVERGLATCRLEMLELLLISVLDTHRR